MTWQLCFHFITSIYILYKKRTEQEIKQKFADEDENIYDVLLTDEEMEALYNRIIDKVKNILLKDIYENKNDFNDFKMKLYQINDEIKRNPLLRISRMVAEKTEALPKD